MDNRHFVLPEEYVLTRSSARAIKAIRHRLRDAWEVDADFFPKFFPIDDGVREIYRTLEKRLHNGTRWSNITMKPVSVSRLYTPLNNLWNEILRAFGLGADGLPNERLCLNTSRTGVNPNVDYSVRPSLLLAGAGKYFICSNKERPFKDYAQGISVLQIRLDNHDETAARDRLAVTMQQLVFNQFNRRFAFGIVMSQHTLTVHMFDRSGAVSSPLLNYHEEPVQFCALIAGLASTQPERLGLDTSIFRGHGEGIVRIREAIGESEVKDVDYILDATLYYSSDFAGRGTVCFAVHEDAIPKNVYVIKDSWATADFFEGKESEASLIAHARRQGVTKGVPLIRHSENVCIKDHTGRLGPDTVLSNRQHSYDNHLQIERIHTRLVMSPRGKALYQFSSQKELLVAFHDAVLAHRNLYQVANILHRDIKPANILIHPEGQEGDRGVLIDFDHAIRVDNNSPYSSKKKIGTYLFMSVSALKGKEPHTYLDDLESFFYVIFYLALTFNGPDHMVEELPEPLSSWTQPLAFRDKEGYLMTTPCDEVNAWFGAPFQALVDRMHSLFNKLVTQKALAIYKKQPPPAINSSEIYDEILSHIRQAIDDLELEGTGPHSWNTELEKGTTTHLSPENGEQANQTSLDKPQSNRQKFRRTICATTAAADRPRRYRVNYGTREV